MSDASTELPEAAAVDTPAAAEAAAARPMPGRALREAREAKNLTIFEVAQSLKFGPRQIEALEADEYATLPPGATFLRGFVRGYAKLLKLDPVPLVAMLDSKMPAVLPDVREPDNMGVAATPIAVGRRSSLPMLLGAGALALLAAGLAAMHFLDIPVAGAPKTASTPQANAVPAVRAPEIRIESTPAAAPVPEPPPLTPDMRQLVFAFQDKSWVEVKDATQRIIFSAENAAGSRQAVVGKPPFQLVIGNAAKVELQYEDRQVDLKPYIRAEVARLTLE